MTIKDMLGVLCGLCGIGHYRETEPTGIKSPTVICSLCGTFCQRFLPDMATIPAEEGLT